MLKISTVKSEWENRKNKGGLLGGLGYVGGSIAAGIGGIGEGIIDVASAGIALLGGDTEYAKYVFKDNVVGDWHQSLTESYNPTGVMQFIGDVGQGIGQSATMLIPYVGVPAFFAGVMSQGISGAAAKTGDVGFKEVAYGVTTGAIEGALESVFGAAGRGAKSIGSAIAKSGGKSAVKSIFSTAARKGLVKEILSSAAGEFFEEAASEVIDVGLQRMYDIDPNAKTTLKDVLYAGVVGAMSGAVMGGAVQIPQTVNHRARGQKIIQDGNAQTLINTATSVADKLAGQGTNFKKAPEWVKTLRGEVDAYNKLKPEEKLGAKGQTILGEMHASLFYAETQAVHYGLTEAIKKSSEENRATLAEYINQTVDKKNRPRDYTAEDIAKNTDDIATQLAIMQFAGNFFDYDSAIADMEQEQGIGDVVNAMQTEAQEQAAAAQAEQGAEINLTAEAVANQANAVNIDANAGIITDQTVPIATEKNEAVTVEGKRDLASKTAQESGEVAGQAVESKTEEKSGEAKNEGEAGQKSGEATLSNVETVSESQKRGESEPVIKKAKESLTDEQRRERARERAKKLIEWEKKTSPTVKELNDAREYVKDFDSLPVKMQTSVIRMIRSAEGKVDKKIVKAVANLMTLRRRNGSLVTPDLEFRFAEGIGDRGLYTHVGDRTLVLINADTDFKNTIRGTIAHELVHYIENKQGYGALALYARRTTRPEAIAKIEKEYNEHYEAVYTAEEEANGLRGDALKKKVAERMATDEHKELIDSEVVARIVGDRMTNEKFLQRYAQKDDAMIKKLGRFLKGAIAELKNKDKETTTILYDMTRLFDNALAGPTVKNSSETKTAKSDENNLKAKAFSKVAISTALYDALDHNDSGDDNLILMSKMPRFIENNFGISGDLYVYRDHLYENTVSKERALEEGRPTIVGQKNRHFHNLGEERMIEAIMSINSPIMSVEVHSKNNNPTVIMALPVLDDNGSPLRAVLSFYSNQNINGSFDRKPHIVLTITPSQMFESSGARQGWAEFVSKAVEEGRVLSYDKEKGSVLSVIAQQARLGNITEASLTDSITRFKKSVKDFKEKNKIYYDLAPSKNVTRTNSEKVQVIEESKKGAKEAVFGKRDLAARPISEKRALLSDAKYSISMAGNIAENTEKYNDKHGVVDGKSLEKGIGIMKSMASLMKYYLDKPGILPPDVIGKTAWKNGSYGRTMENTTLCIRTLTYEYFKDEVAKAIGRPLTVSESLLASQKIYDIATYPQCIYCYVAADRKSFDAFIGEYVADMDKYIKLLKKGGNDEALFEEYLHGRKPTDAQKKRWAEWKRIAKSGEKYISASDITTRSQRNKLINGSDKKIAAQVRDAQRYAQSASWAKSVSDYVAYGGDILKFSQKMVEMLNSEYGLRMYSFSDYTPAFIVENMQMVLDASVRGLKVLSYTKDADYVRIFGESGMAINMSCFARWDAKTGTYVEDSRQGMKWEEVKELREKYKNAGAVMVVTNDKMLDWALAQDWIDVVIPYHIVKTGTTIAGEYQWRNYTRESADYAENKTANVYPTEHNNDFKTFRKLVEERGITPRFKEWYDKAVRGDISGDTYMKLVNEVRLPASKLAPVKPNFNLEAAMASFGVKSDGSAIEGGYVDLGGYMGNWFKKGVDVEQEVKIVAEDIESGKTVADVSYGRQSVREASKPVIKRDLAPKKSTESADKGDAAYERAKGQMYKREADEARRQTAEARRDAMSLAQQIARDAYETDAKTFTQKEIDELIVRINQYSTDEFKDIMDEKKATISKIDKEQFAYDIYVAFHLASADKRVMDRMNVLADRLARQYLDDVFYTDNGKRVYLKDVFDEDTYKKYVNTFRRKIIASFKQMGRETTHARLTAKYRAELAKLQNKLLDAETKGKNLRELQWQAKQLRTSVDIQKRSPQDEGIYNVEKEMSRIADERGRVSAKQADKAFERFYVFLTSDSEKADSSLAEMAQVEGESLVALLEDYKKLRKGHENQYLNSQEMAVAAKIIAGGRKILREYNRVFYNGHWVDMAQLAEETVNDLTSFSGAKKEYKTKLGEWFDTQVNKRFLQGTYFYNILSPETVIETLEGFKKNGVLTTLYHAVREATQRSEHMAVRLKKPFAEFLDSKDNVWTDDSGKKHTFRDKLNKKIVNVNGNEITLGEAIYLYMLTKREHSHLGLKESGYVTYDENNQVKLQFKIEYPEAAQSFIYGQLDSTDKAFLDMAENFFNKTASKIKYDADMKILGYTNNQDAYYVPIIRDRYERMANVTDQRQSIGSIVTVYNKSFTQNIVQNAKALEGKNIMAIINDHADGLADYSELYLPLKSFDRVYNTRVITDKAQVTSIRKVLNNEVWNGSDNYFKNLFADIQGQSGERGVMNSIVGKLRSGWVNSVLGLNLKVVATQTTSYVAANQVIEMKYLAPALAKFVGNQSELGARADEYSDIIEARSFEMGALKAQGNIDTVAKWGEKSGFMINWMDRRVCLAIFHAAELKAEAEGAGAVGTVENATAAAKIADEVIYTTQAMTSKAERSALQRSKNEVAKTLSMFTSDSVKQLSHFYGNLMRYFAHRERAKTDASYEASLKADAKKVGRSATTLVMTGIMLGLITQAFKYLYAKEEEEPEDKAKDFAIDIVSSTLNILPIVSDVMDKFVHGYDISLNVFDIANDTIEDTSKLFNMAGKAMSGEYVSNAEVGKNVINAVKTYGTVLGVPIAPVERTVTGLLRRFVPSAIYGYDAMFSNPSYTSDLKKAVESGDERLADHIFTQLYKSEVAGVYTAEELELVANLYSKGYTGVIPQRIGETVNDVKLNKKQRREFEKIYSEASGKVTEMISTDEFKALSEEQQAKVIKAMYSLYYNRAASEVTGKEWSNAQAYAQLTDNYADLFIAQAYKSGLEATTDASGKEMTVKSQFVEYLQNLGLSGTDYIVIAYANSVRDKATRAALIEHINSLSLSDEAKAHIAAKLSLEIKDGKVVEKSE